MGGAQLLDQSLGAHGDIRQAFVIFDQHHELVAAHACDRVTRP